MQVSDIVTKTRNFGHNYGLPAAHIRVVEGSGSAQDIIAKIIQSTDIPLVVIKTEVLSGIGTLMAGLRSIGRTTELVFQPEDGAYNWLKQVDFPVAEYDSDSKFQWFSLLKYAFIHFSINTQEELELSKEHYYELRYTPCGKWMTVPKSLEEEALALASGYPRCRVGVKCQS